MKMEEMCDFAAAQDLVWTQPNAPESLNLYIILEYTII